MAWFFKFLNSSIGKKFIMALTGLLLCLFLIIHLGNNLMLLVDKDIFNGLVGGLGSLKPLVRVIEVLLAILFMIHIVNGIRLTIQNKKATKQGYKVSGGSETSSISSRTMAISGTTILVFLVFHLNTIWAKFQEMHTSHDNEFFDVVVSSQIGFGNIWVTIFYIIALILLSLHLKHGFQSAFQTFGLSDSRYKSIINYLAVFFWLVIPGLFITIAVYFGFIFNN
jgi:succinate dehydrogenase / fumarate reductase, cytochrome b subunit